MKDVFVLSKNSWHSKLMKFIWGIKPEDFSHMCPYFWLSVFNVVFLPFILLFKLLIFLASKGVDFWDRSVDSWVEREMKKAEANPESLRILAQKWAGGCRSSRLKRLSEKLYYNPLYERWCHFRSLYHEEQKKKQLTNKQRIVQINKYTKPIGKAILYLAATATIALIVWGVYALIIALINNPQPILHGLWGFARAILAMAFIISFVFVTMHFFKDTCAGKKTIRVVGAPFRAIRNGFSFLVSMFKEHCPAIKWKE